MSLKDRVDRAYEGAARFLKGESTCYLVVVVADAEGKYVIREGGTLDAEQRQTILTQIREANGVGSLINLKPKGLSH